MVSSKNENIWWNRFAMTAEGTESDTDTNCGVSVVLWWLKCVIDFLIRNLRSPTGDRSSVTLCHLKMNPKSHWLWGRVRNR